MNPTDRLGQPLKVKRFKDYHPDLQKIVELTRTRGWVHLGMPRVSLYNGDLAYGFEGMYPCDGPSFTFDQWHKCTEAHKNRFDEANNE